MIEHILDLDKSEQLINLFKDIQERNTFLFLGAGASVTKEKGFLSHHLIQYYEDKKHKSLNINDIQTFVDVLASTPGLSRDEFDNYVDECLRKLKVTEAHKILASINWRQIITTNYDLLVEQAFQEIQGSPRENLRIKTIRGKKEHPYQSAQDEVKYIKLNGCISSKKEFPLVFSTEDFKDAKSYYKNVFKELKNPSERLKFVSIGYSFRDDFAKYLFSIIEEQNYRDNRIMYNVDPYIEDTHLPYFTSKGIVVIKTTFDDFMQRYSRWEQENADIITKKKKPHFSTAKHSQIKLNYRSLLRLEGNLVQLDENYKSRNITIENFYKGEEPDYKVITKNYDVVKDQTVLRITSDVEKFLQTSKSVLVPVVFLTGSFGTGKSTFAYRLINSVVEDSKEATVAFEILDPLSINVIDVVELINSSGADQVILYCNGAEVDHIFKGILELRNKLSREQVSVARIIIYTTIRENILEINKLDKSIANSISINVDENLTDEQIGELLEKLKSCGLVKFRDMPEKKTLINKIKSIYNGDSYITLLDIISNGKHIDSLIDAYKQLSNQAREAFLYTSLLYQFGIPMPVGLLKNLITKDWDSFRKSVLEAEGKGILIQSEAPANASDADSYFRTKHALISKKLADTFLPTKDKKYKYYNTIINRLTFGYKNSLLVVDLLKAIGINDELGHEQIDKLFDSVYAELSDDPRFLLHYAINLQHRGDNKSLEKAIELLVYAEGLNKFTTRDHRLVHRRAVVNYHLAKNWFRKEKKELVKTLRYVSEARELFKVKLLYDPCSSYSYFDYIQFEIWCLENLNMSEEEQLVQRIVIEELFDLALKVVFEYRDKITDLQFQYNDRFRFHENEAEYLKFIEEKYGEAEYRPYALVLLLNFYLLKDTPPMKWKMYLDEIEHYPDNEEVAKFLFKYYGRNLNFLENRVKFFDIVKSFDVESHDSLRYKYFSYIAESYNKNFPFAYDIFRNIRNKFTHLNVDFQQVWRKDNSSEEEVFEGIIISNRRGNSRLRIPVLNWDFPIKSGFEGTKQGDKVNAVLHFHLNGIFAELVDVD